MHMLNNSVSRRRFMKQSTVAAGALATLPTFSVGADTDKLGVAVIGAGGMGGYSVSAGLKERLVALVDIDDNIIAKTMKDKVKDLAKPKIYHDFRRMLDECQKEIDVVLIATPDHQHAPPAIRAIDLGKHVFAQKPLAHNIYECDALAKAAQRKKVLTQMGNQGYCGEGIRRVAELIQAGAIGRVLETHTILGRNFGGTGGRPESKPAPAHVHWDEWLGPAPAREYHEGLHTFGWRNWKAFGTGTIGDMACHHVAFPFMALRLWEVPKFTMECLNTSGGSEEKYQQDNIVCYHIPARDRFAACKMFVYDHTKLKPQVMLDAEKLAGKTFGEFTLFVGEKGMLGSNGELLGKEKLTPPEIKNPLPRAKAGGPIEDLYACIRTGGTPASSFAEAGAPLTIIALAGHLAQYAGKGEKVEFDMEKLSCTNKPELNKHIKREYRKGWEV
jgi:predicted dehydrogenase